MQSNILWKNADSHQLVDDIYDVIKGIFPITHNFDKREGVFDNVWACSAAYKNSSFMSEREYRVLTWDGKRFDKSDDLQTVTTLSQIKKCLYFDWKKRCKEKQIPIETFIKRIVIGPKSSQSIKG